MSGVNDNDSVVLWRERAQLLVDTVKGRSTRGSVLAEELAERIVSQEKDVEALLSLLAVERERNEALASGIAGYPERKTVDGEVERLRDYALSVRIREVAAEKALNAERMNVARLEARLAAAGLPLDE